MAPQLPDLPDELLVEVLGCLPKADLKSTRLTSTRLACVGAQWLFQRIYFAPRKSAIETFLNISANPIFAQNVKELFYDGRLFLHEYTAYKCYSIAFESQVLCQSVVNFADSELAEIHDAAMILWNDRVNEDYHESLADSLVCYARFFDQQQSILEDRKDYEALSTGLKNLPNLTTVIALDNFYGRSDFVPLRTDDHSWYQQRSQREMRLHVQPTSWARGWNDGRETKKWDARGIQHLFQAVSKHGQNVRELHLASELANAPMSLFEMDQDVYDDACVLAQRLKLLKVHLYIPRSELDNDLFNQEDCFDGILSEAKNLSCLAMSGRIDVDFFKAKPWPHLEILRLGDIGMSLDDLKAITRAYKETLRELLLRNVYLSGEEGWIGAAKEVGKYLRLRQVSILKVSDEVTREHSDSPYLEDEDKLAVAHSFMQSISKGPFGYQIQNPHFIDFSPITLNL